MVLAISTGSIIFYLILGVLAGILSAALGIGSGILLVPVLSLIAAFSQKEAQGIALTVMIPMAMMGAFRYYINPDIQIDYKVVLILAVAVVIGANIGATIVANVSNQTLKIAFACLLFIAGIRMIWSALQGA